MIDGATQTTACGGLDSTAQRPPSATSSKEGAEQTGRRGEGEDGEAFPDPAPAPGKSSAAEQTGLAFAVAEALADEELEPAPELVEAAAAAVEATAALSAASASEFGEIDDRDKEGVAPVGRKGGLPLPFPFSPPLRRG